MSAGRIALIAVGVLVAVGALFLVVRGFRSGPTAAASEATAAPAAETPPPNGGKPEEKPAPRWQSFLHPDERQTPPRPVVPFAQGLPSPFERPVASVSVSAKTENPGFRLEGISLGAEPVALVSGRAVRQGDTLQGFRVVRIGRREVTLAGPEGTRLQLALGEPAPPPLKSPLPAPPRAPRASGAPSAPVQARAPVERPLPVDPHRPAAGGGGR